MTPTVVPSPPDVLVLGDANPDLVLRGDVRPRFGQSEQLLTAADLVLGGSGAITAHALARLGVRTALLAAVGDDLFGADVRARLAAAGVDVGSLITVPEPTGLSVVLSDGASRSTLTHIGALDAPPPPWQLPGDIPAARHLHVSSYFLQRRRAAALPDLLRLARTAGLTISLDTNLDPGGRFDGLAAVLPAVDLLLINADEALALARALTSYDPGDDPGYAAELLAVHTSTVVVKDGPNGALLASDHTVLHAPGHAVDLVDTTGAGDTFNAGYLAAFLDGRPPRECLTWAVFAGAAAVTASGGTAGQPTRSQLLEAMRAQAVSQSWPTQRMPTSR